MSDEQPPTVPPSLSELAADFDDHSKALQALSAAQEEISQLRDARKEERIGWIVVSVILFNCAFLLNAENAIAPIIIGLLQIAVLSVMAKRLGVEEFYSLFAKIAARVGNLAGGQD